jgi:phage tail-like protein
VFIPVGALYLDNGVEVTTPARLDCINQFPADGQTGIPAADVLGSHPIHLTVVDYGSFGPVATGTSITVTIGTTTTVVWDGTTFAAGWSTSSSFAAVSSDTITTDEHRFILIRDTPFASLDLVQIRVQASTSDLQVLDKSYSFTVEDLTRPVLLLAKTRGLTQVRVKFDEAMEQGTEDTGDALLIRDISGGIEIRPREPVAGTKASGSITVVLPSLLVDGETFTLDDGLNTPTIFEFDDNAVVTPGSVGIDLTVITTLSEVRDRIILAINSVGNLLRIGAASGGVSLINLTHDIVGTIGNNAVVESVADPGFVVVGLSGGINDGASEDPPRVIAQRNVFSSDDVGLFIGIAGAENALNNDIFRISSLIDAKRVEIDEENVRVEALANDVLITISPYRIQGVPDSALVLPYFEPIVIDAETVASDEVELTLHAELTPSRDYDLEAFGVEDLHDNALLFSSIGFTSESLGIPQGRIDGRFNFLDLWPDYNFKLDKTRDTERQARCFDEVLQLLLHDIDRFPEIIDIDQVSADNLDALLCHLGAPFTFITEFSEVDKRRLASVLVDAYKRKGVELGMEGFLSFVLGIQFNIRPFNRPEENWTLGVSLLGEDTILGPSTSFLKFAFEVLSPVPLTETQRRRLVEMVEWMKPSHTHFVRIIEPGTPGAPPVITWVLGTSALGESTILD